MDNKRELDSSEESAQKKQKAEPSGLTTSTITTTTTTTTTTNDTTKPPDASSTNKPNNSNRGGRGRGGRGGRGKGRGGNARGRKGRDDDEKDEDDDGEESVGGAADEDDEVADDEIANAPKVAEVDVESLVAMPVDPAARKKKIAMLVGYNGAGFFGMQRNPGVRTIEDELEVAIYKAGGISKENFRALTKVDWMRCARTDKGVSALGNVVSFKVTISPPELDEMQRRINSFLDPAIRIFSMRRVNKKFNAKLAVNARSYEYVLPTFALAPADPTEPFEFTEKTREKVNEALGLYTGTQKFHNFTLGKKPTDESAKRYITSFKCGPAFEQNGVQLVILTVVGQSFMIHQIRKMVGMLIAVARRGYLVEEGLVAIRKIFAAAMSNNTLAIPMAPSLGLLLEKCIYSAWDKKFSPTYGSLNFDEAEEDRANFKSQIYGYIIEKDKEGNVYPRSNEVS